MAELPNRDDIPNVSNVAEFYQAVFLWKAGRLDAPPSDWNYSAEQLATCVLQMVEQLDRLSGQIESPGQTSSMLDRAFEIAGFPL